MYLSWIGKRLQYLFQRVSLMSCIGLLLVLTISLTLFLSIASDSKKLRAQRPSSILSKPTTTASRTSTTHLRAQTTNTMQQASRVLIPDILYGTAWKKDRTADLVELAVKQGFRAIDTACQPKHYQEAGVGEALQRLYQQQIIQREDIFLQTKFTSLDGQDPQRIPYNPKASLPDQVMQSFAKSCENLHTTYLDSLVLHSPMHTMDETMQVWRVFEQLHSEGKVRYLGISNTYQLSVLQRLYQQAVVKPQFLQNRFYRESGYDHEIRQFCRDHDIKYQSFWTLTANPHIIRR